jgi:hypothetical protein
MFNRTRLVIQERIESRIAPTATYQIKDHAGTLLGYLRDRKRSPGFWIEGKNGTRRGEVRFFPRQNSQKERYEVVDAGNALLATIRRSGSEWWIDARARDQQLAKGRKSSKVAATYHILTPDGGLIAKIERKRGLLRDAYQIEVTRRSISPLTVMGFAHIMMTQKEAKPD